MPAGSCRSPLALSLQPAVVRLRTGHGQVGSWSTRPLPFISLPPWLGLAPNSLRQGLLETGDALLCPENLDADEVEELENQALLPDL
ncbi:hypothetical protein E5288_WYG017488 [Bos mutus]|uniref:Uncharacterized protein n=1 Tax=Bos mutus TaxID=72004 RepID=A0A6B0SJM1_9CETA|nr:hypothetical protein [Bos mutus]